MRCCSTRLGSPKRASTSSAPTEDNLVKAINVLKPTTDLLLKYNPEYTCLLIGAKWSLDNGAYQAAGGNGRTILIDDAFLFGDDPYRYPDNLPVVAAKGGPGGKPGCGSLPDVSKNWPVRQLVTNTGWGTGLDIRPNPGIGHPWWVDYFPVTRGGTRTAEHPRVGPARRPDRCRTRVRRPTARRFTAPTELRCTRRRSGAATGAATAMTGPPTQTPDLTATRRGSSHERQPRGRRCGAGVFVVVCLRGASRLFAVFAQLRFSAEQTYTAEFTNVSGLKERRLGAHRRRGSRQGQTHLDQATAQLWSSSPPTTRWCSPRAPGR